MYFGAAISDEEQQLQTQHVVLGITYWLSKTRLQLIITETCKYCLCSTNEPLIHYFSECPNTKSFFNIKDIYVSQHLSQFELAATLANYLLKLDNFDSFVSKFPPPR